MEKFEVIPVTPDHAQPANGHGSMSVSRSQPTELPPAAPSLKRDYGGILEYWQMVRRHQGIVVVAIALGLLAGYFRTLPQERIYQAHTSLEIQGMNEDFLNMRNVTPTASTSYSPDYDIQTQVRILQSRGLVKAVYDKMAAKKRTGPIEAPDRLSAWRKALNLSPPTPESLWQEALGMAAGSVRVRASGLNRIVDVSCDSTNPQIAAEFLNVLAQEYIQQNLEARWKSTERTGEWLTGQLQDLKIKLEKADDQLQAYARSSRLTITDEKNNVDEQKLVEMQKDLSNAESDRVAKQSKYEMASNSPLDALPDVVDDSNLADYEKTLTDLRRQYAQLRTTFTPAHAEVKRTQAQINMVESELEKERSNILRRIRNDYEAALRREKLLSVAYANQAQLVTDQGVKVTHYNILKREVDTSRTLYETMLEKLKEASVASALRASNIRVVDDAIPPGEPYRPDVYRSCIMGLLCGLSLGIAYAVFRERADRTIQDPGDVSYYLNLPELGVIPAGSLQPALKGGKVRDFLPGGQVVSNGNGIPVNGNSNGHHKLTDFPLDQIELETWTKRTSLLAESFRTTLTSVFFSGTNGSRPRVLVLTSASPKEGKTTVASNLAISVAEINHRVVIIDADMRRPRLHKVFGTENAHGLSDVLMQNHPLEDEQVDAAVNATGVSGLFIMPSGTQRHSASTLVHSDRLPELITILRRKFDTIVIDTPPMVNISDARMLARHGDALILVVRSAVTTRDAAALAQRRFAEDGIPIMGVILNGWNPHTPGYHYYRYYYAGYQHYYGQAAAKENES
jgi:capsular exopolysaccharide synthesis family protein